MEQLKTNPLGNARKSLQKTNTSNSRLGFRKYKNYLDDSCEFIRVPDPGPIRMSNFLSDLIPLQIENMQKMGSYMAGFSQANPYQNMNPQKPKIERERSELFFREDKREPRARELVQKRVQDLEEVLVPVKSIETKLNEIKDERFITHVRFYNNDDSICGHNFYLNHHGKEDKDMEITKLENNKILIKYIPKKKKQEPVKRDLNKGEFRLEDVISDFFRVAQLFSKGKICLEKMKKRLFGKEPLVLRYEKIQDFLLKFFKMEDFSDEMTNLNKFEGIFIGVILQKKKYKQWTSSKLNFGILQKSPTKLKKSKIFETFMKFFLRHLVDNYSKMNFKTTHTQINHFFEDILGRDRDPIFRNIKSFCEKIRSIRNIKHDETPRKIIYSKDELLRNLTQKFVQNSDFRKRYDRVLVGRVTHLVFEDYKEKKIPRTISRIVKHFKNKIELGEDKMVAFLNFCVSLKANSKFRGIWSKAEFEHGMEIFLDFAGY